MKQVERKPVETETGLTRRQFSAAAVMALLSGVTITITGCGGGGSSSGPAGPIVNSGDVVGSISANHGHSAILRAAQVMAGNAVTLDIHGSADHPHSVELTSTQVQQIAAGQQVSKTSSVDQAHDHLVTFN